jgi:hypothetical protein
VLPPVKLRDKKIRRKRSRDRGAKNGSSQGASLENPIWFIYRRRFPLFFQEVGKRLP